MTTKQTQMPSFIYAGQGGPLSLAPLEGLLEAGFRPSAVLMPESVDAIDKKKSLPVSPVNDPDSLAYMAHEEDLPLLSWQKTNQSGILAKMSELSPDLVICSCFPWRIPSALLDLPEYGWWNLHPSLLPSYRGPNPLYWQQQANETATGISLHQMDDNFDTGPILATAECKLRLVDLRESEELLGVEGGRLLVSALKDLMDGELVPEPQDEALASYQSSRK